MSEFKIPTFSDPPRRGPGGSGGPPPIPSSRPPPPPDRFGWVTRAIAAVLVLAIGYGMYYWTKRRVVVEHNCVLVLLKKNGSKTLPDDQIIIPRRPDPKEADYQQKLKQWEQTYGDCNGIEEQVYTEGTYFQFSPFDYERSVIEITDTAIVPQGKVGLVVKKFGKSLDTDKEGRVIQIMADPARDQRGPLPIVLSPGRYNEYANPFAYQIKQVSPVQVEPGHRGVVTLMSGKPAGDPNQYLVNPGEQGMQRVTEPEGLRFVNYYEKRITPISIRSQRFEMSLDPKTGKDESIRFPSSDSFEIKLDGFVEWSIVPEKLPLLYTQYGTGGELLQDLEDKVILPYARSFCRLVGSRYTAREFISGETKLKFQEEFEHNLRDACEKQGIEILQALVRNIEPPMAIKEPINDREIAREQIFQFQQQIKVADSQAKLVTQEETSKQNMAIGEANKQVVTITKRAEQEADVSITKAQQELAVAKLKLQAAKQQAEAIVARGRAAANVVLLQKQAEAEPLRQQVQAFGEGDGYARYFFYQKVAPSVKSILANTDGPFGDLFKQFTAPAPAAAPAPSREPSPKVTQAPPNRAAAQPAAAQPATLPVARPITTTTTDAGEAKP